MLFFERQKTIRGEWPQIYSRDMFPKNVRIQCWQLLSPDEGQCKSSIKNLRFALGVEQLNDAGEGGTFNPYSYGRELYHFFLHGLSRATELQNVEYVFSVLELIINPQHWVSDDIINQINYRLRLGGIGYKIIDHTLISIEDDFISETAIIPAISIINREEFSASYAYLHQAFLDYKEGSPKSLETAIDNTSKAVEALLKVIFSKMNISYEENNSYQPLILKAKQNGLFPNIDDDKLAPLENALKGLGSLRNREAGHGDTKRNATDRLVRLAIHHAVSNMLYIAETYLEEHKK